MNRGRTNRGAPRPRSRSSSRVRGSGRSAAGSASGSTSSALRTHDDQGNMIDDEAISTFTKALEGLPKDEWRARTIAFEALIEALPGAGLSGTKSTNNNSGLAPNVYINSGIIPWYKSYTALRRLCNPISSLLLNARSTVVKHTSHHLAFLMQRVKDLNPPNADTAKYLMKDLLPTVLLLHAQTSKVIRGYAVEMMTIIIPLCRFKSGLPELLERLRKDKSRDVREGAVNYLRLIVRYWAANPYRNIQLNLAEDNDISTLSASEKSAEDQKYEYLTSNICKHIGNGLARAMMDQAQSVRLEARNAFELFRHRYPELWNQIVQKKNGILSSDQRLKKSVMNAAVKADAEGRGPGTNVDNYYPQYEEGEDYDAKTLGSAGSRGSATVNSWASNSSFMSRGNGIGNDSSLNRGRSDSSLNRGRSRAGVGGGGSSVRSARSRSNSVGVRSGSGLSTTSNSRSTSRTRSRANGNTSRTRSRAIGNTHGNGIGNGNAGDGGSKKLPPSSKLASGSSSVGSSSRSSRSKKTNPFGKATNSPTRSSSTSNSLANGNGNRNGILRSASGAGSKFSSENGSGTYINNSTSNDNVYSDNSPPPVEELSDATSPLSSNTNSTSSQSFHGAPQDQHPHSQLSHSLSHPPPPRPGVNYLVSNQLLSAHKAYIDELMESLRTEMNTIRDFEALLVKAQNNPDEATGTYGPTEDDVLGYYESVYSYLDRGSENSTRLRHEMERIGRTEFQA